MITKDNILQLLKLLGFEKESGIYTKTYCEDNDIFLKVDIKNEKLIYPEAKGLKISGEFTTNFSANENFVVFECIDRFLSKGYKPEHIELEPKWKIGHGASGGRADILIKDNTGNALLIVECKTAGNEFEKEWRNTLNGRGQLFTYAKQAGSTQHICLYSSDIDNDKIIYNNYIISLKDNKRFLEEIGNKDAQTFEKAKALNADDLYLAWKETYKQSFATKGIFERDIEAYKVGKLKYTINDLREISNKEIQKKYHEFATILRQHNVSGHENAFDKLVNLFLCKVVDESKNGEDLKFYWKEIAYDNYFDLQDRMQKLYQIGMKEFLGEEVTYIDNKQIDEAFRFFNNDPDATRDTIKKYFRQLKFFTNNDFAFLEVHNEKLFYQNAEVLLKMVKMLQDIRLQSDNDNQFLGDLFEGFLDKGVKQSEGQFFTPMPIVKFILYSLPLEKIYKDSEEIPQVIDYACGAGHFLTELAKQIKPVITTNQEIPIEEYYKAIHGIEKEYRLSKVSKVSTFMYGQNEIDIIYADALSRKTKLKDNSFSVLVANPPYSVKGFLETLEPNERTKFDIYKVIEEKTIATNNSIETFFIERAKQLLKPGGIAGIILPSSILSNNSSVYTATREILIKYFYIKAIVEFGSQTFGKTGTNTVVLFLQRRKENPSEADHWRNRVNDWFSEHDKSQKQYEDIYKLNEYCVHIGIPFEDYKTLLTKEPNDNLLAQEIFVEYKSVFDKSTEVKNLISKKNFRDKSIEDKTKELKERFIRYIIAIEKDKIYYYVLASSDHQQTIIVKSPAGNAEQKKFLGYEWSNAKGSEGIKYLSQPVMFSNDSDEEANELIAKLSGLQNIQTPLYDPQNKENSEKLNYLIAQHFENNLIEIPETLSAFVKYHNFIDLLDFTRKDFNKAINLNPQNITEQISSKWHLAKLGDISEIKKGTSLTQANSQEGNIKVIAGGTNFAYYHNTSNRNENIITISASGASAGFVNFWKEKIFASDCTTVKGESDLSTQYIYIVLKNLLQKQLYSLAKGAAQPHVYKDDIIKLYIPYPPQNIQQEIVAECERIDEEVKEAENKILDFQNQISKSFIPIFENSPKTKLNTIKTLLKRGRSTRYGNTNIQVIKSGQARGFENFDFTNKYYAESNSVLDERALQKGDLLINSTGVGTAGRVTLFNLEGKFVADSHITILRLDPQVAIPKYVLYCLAHIGFKNIERMAKGSSGQIELTLTTIESIQIPKLSIEDQTNLVKSIENIEIQIQNLNNVITNAPQKKQAILKKYL